MISEELKARLQKETARIHELARLTGDDELLTYKVKFLYDHPLIYWQKRIEAAHGLLINKNLALAQAEIAKLHGLVYEKNANNGRWIVQDDLMLINNNQLEYSLDETRRSDSYFYEKKTRFSSVVEDVVKKTKDSKCSTDTNKFTFPKVDLALLAHACQLPIDALLVCIDPINVLAKEELKICKDEIFNQYINFHNNGKDLFSNDITFLEQFSQRANNKIIIQHLSNQAESTPAKPEIQAVAEEIAEPNKPQHEVRPGIALRGVKQLSKSEKSINIVADKPISIQINKPEYFSSWEAIVFEKDSENRIKLI